MRNLLHILVLLMIGSCGISSCTPHVVSPPPDADAAPATPQAACDEMAAVGCLVRSTCASTLAKINADTQHFEHIDVTCIANARSSSDVVKCGVDCEVTPRGSSDQ